MPGSMEVAHRDGIPDRESRRRRQRELARPWHDRTRERKPAAGTRVELLARQHALLDEERRDADDDAVVVRRREVPARLDALDRVSELVHVEGTEHVHAEPAERIAERFPRLVEDGFVALDLDRPEADDAAEVVDAVHRRAP